MRLYLSDKAARALKNLPPEDYIECGEHGRQRYARTPRPLAEEKGDWMCGECVKTAEAELSEQTKAKRQEEEAAKEAKKAEKKAAKSATAIADEALEARLSICKDHNRAVRELQQGLHDLHASQREAEEQAADAQARIEQAQRDLQAAQEQLAQATAKVPGVETELEAERGKLDTEVTDLQERLNEADEAWKAIPPRQRKKRDRRSRHSAVQIINANKRWHERRGSGAAEGEGEEPEAEAPALEELKVEAPAPQPATETPAEDSPEA